MNDKPDAGGARKPFGALRDWFAHAFAIEAYDESSLAPEERIIIDRLAWQINRRGLTTPAIFFVQSNRHANFLGSSAAVFAQPFFEMSHVFINGLLRHIGLNVPPADYPVLCSAFEKRYSIEYLTQRLEAHSAGEAPLMDYEAEEQAAREADEAMGGTPLSRTLRRFVKGDEGPPTVPPASMGK